MKALSIKVINEKPPCWGDVEKKFDLAGKKPIFAYGTVVYNPFNIFIPEDLIVHESVHLKQQGKNETVAKLWWIRYLENSEFLVSQEVEAYNAQYRFMCRYTKDKNRRFRYLHLLALQLAGTMYGNPVTYSEALKRIKEGK